MSLATEMPGGYAEAAIPTEPIWRLSVEQYHEMLRNGILGEDDPVELLDGWLVTKMTQNTFHRAAVKLGYRALDKIIPQGWYVDSQGPITLSASEPEPDLVVVRGDTLQYLDRHPGPGDVALIVEVADASLHRDRLLKKADYAGAKIPAYWIVNLVDRQVEVYSDPAETDRQPGYRHRRDYTLNEAVPVVIDGREVARIAVQDLLPR